MRWIFLTIFICALSAPLLALDFEAATDVQVRGQTIVLDGMVESDRIIIDALYTSPTLLKKKIYHISFDSITCVKVYSDGKVGGWKINLPSGIRRFIDYFLIDIDDSRGISWKKVY